MTMFLIKPRCLIVSEAPATHFLQVREAKSWASWWTTLFQKNIFTAESFFDPVWVEIHLSSLGLKISSTVAFVMLHHLTRTETLQPVLLCPDLLGYFTFLKYFFCSEVTAMLVCDEWEEVIWMMFHYLYDKLRLSWFKKFSFRLTNITCVTQGTTQIGSEIFSKLDLLVICLVFHRAAWSTTWSLPDKLKQDKNPANSPE